MLDTLVRSRDYADVQYGSHQPHVAIYIEIKIKQNLKSVPQSHQPHCKCSLAMCSWGYCNGQHKPRTFLSSQEVLRAVLVQNFVARGQTQYDIVVKIWPSGSNLGWDPAPPLTSCRTLACHLAFLSRGLLCKMGVIRPTSWGYIVSIKGDDALNMQSLLNTQCLLSFSFLL